MLDQHEGDAGSASALMGSSHMVMGSVGILIVSLKLWDRVLLIGALILGLGLLSMALWVGVVQPLVLRGKRS